MFKLFTICFIIFLVFILLMALGVLFGRQALKGSCGGLSRVMGEACSVCEKKDSCKKKIQSF